MHSCSVYMMTVRHRNSPLSCKVQVAGNPQNGGPKLCNPPNGGLKLTDRRYHYKPIRVRVMDPNPKPVPC